MSVSEFLKGLPSHNEQNFSLFFTEKGIRASTIRPSVYLPTEDLPSEQIIVPEKVNAILRQLFQQRDKRHRPRKRRDNPEVGGDVSSRQRPRMERETN